MNREELAWAGGFFSGEGCTILAHYKPGGHNKKPYPSMHINHTTVEELKRFNAALGNRGRIIGPYKPASKLSKKLRYDINLYGYAKVRDTTMELWDFLSTAKREQACKVLDAYQEYGREVV